MLKTKLQELAQWELDRCTDRNDLICKDKECLFCQQCKNQCDICLIPQFICRNRGKSGLVSYWHGKHTFADIIGTPAYNLAHFVWTQIVQTNDCSVAAYVAKAEELGLGEMVMYWKMQLIENELKVIKEKLNELIMKLNK